jgi:fructose-specific component phosphotransferase system IIB-like protein
VSGASTVDIVASSGVYNLTDQKSGSLITSGRLTIINKNDSDKIIVIAFSNAVENGTLNGKKRYTLTIRVASDASTKMVGLANTDDGTSNVLNVIAGNSTDIFPIPADSLVLLSVGSAEYSELRTAVDNAVAEIYDQSDLIASRVAFLMRALEQRINDEN